MSRRRNWYINDNSNTNEKRPLQTVIAIFTIFLLIQVLPIIFIFIIIFLSIINQFPVLGLILSGYIFYRLATIISSNEQQKTTRRKNRYIRYVYEKAHREGIISDREFKDLLQYMYFSKFTTSIKKAYVNDVVDEEQFEHILDLHFEIQKEQEGQKEQNKKKEKSVEYLVS